MKKLVTLIAATCLAASSPAMAKPAPTAADNAQIDAMLKPLFDGMIAGRVRQSVIDAFNRSEMMKAKQSDVALVASQAEVAIGIYGAVRACENVDQKGHGSWVQDRIYICQHDRFLTRWVITMVKMPGGWQPASISFDDKINVDLD